jgi:hypothetical protein
MHLAIIEPTADYDFGLRQLRREKSFERDYHKVVPLGFG